MMRAQSPGFLNHAVLMLKNASLKANDDWDDPDVQISPMQTEEMRRSMREAARLLKEIEPFVKAFEEVSRTRKLVLSAPLIK